MRSSQRCFEKNKQMTSNTALNSFRKHRCLNVTDKRLERFIHDDVKRRFFFYAARMMSTKQSCALIDAKAKATHLWIHISPHRE